MRLMSFDSIQKKLDKKNAELLEVRALRKKLADREKNICAEIQSLQNLKVEVIFLQVKRQIKNENLDVSSGSVLPLLEAFSQYSVAEASSTEKIETQVDSVSKITETERAINEH